MTILVASDIHGSAHFCEKLINAYKEEKADKLLLLGDILYHGPRNDLPTEYDPKKVIAMLNEIKSEILCVRGNCEAEVDQQRFPDPGDAEILADVPLIAQIDAGAEGRDPFRTHPIGVRKGHYAILDRTFDEVVSHVKTAARRTREERAYRINALPAVPKIEDAVALQGQLIAHVPAEIIIRQPRHRADTTGGVVSAR